MVSVRWAEQGDMDFINETFRHPEIYPYISDDGCPKVEDFSIPAIESPYLKFIIGLVAAERAAVFMLVLWNSITYEVHTLILPRFRGSRALEMCRAGFEYVFSKTSCRKVVTQIPTYNHAAYALACRAGMRIEGTNTKSFLKNGVIYDQYIMGKVEVI